MNQEEIIKMVEQILRKRNCSRIYIKDYTCDLVEKSGIFFKKEEYANRLMNEYVITINNRKIQSVETSIYGSRYTQIWDYNTGYVLHYKHENGKQELFAKNPLLFYVDLYDGRDKVLYDFENNKLVYSYSDGRKRSLTKYKKNSCVVESVTSYYYNIVGLLEKEVVNSRTDRTYEYDIRGNCVRIDYFVYKTMKYQTCKMRYNMMGDIEHEDDFKDGVPITHDFKYTYDHYGLWKTKEQYRDGKPFHYFERLID